jgi:hypothetical protein
MRIYGSKEKGYRVSLTSREFCDLSNAGEEVENVVFKRWIKAYERLRDLHFKVWVIRQYAKHAERQKPKTARHESGHAVMAWIQGLKVRSVWMDWDPDHHKAHVLGTAYVESPKQWTPDSVFTEARMLLAGDIAESSRKPGVNRYILSVDIDERRQYGSDAERINYLLRKYAGLKTKKQLREVIRSLQQDVIDIFSVKHVARCIDQLAELLKGWSSFGTDDEDSEYADELPEFIAERITKAQRAKLRKMCHDPKA